MTRTPTPTALARQTTAILRRAGNAKTREQSLKFFKPGDRVALFGVKTPEVRRVARDAFRHVRASWAVEDALEFADYMVRRRELESKVAGLLLLERFQKHFECKFIGAAESWLKGNHCDNWAAVDCLCPTVTTPLVRSCPALVARVKRWARSRNLWVRRAAVVTFVPLARRGEHLTVSYAVVEDLLNDREDLLHKACGWLLREAGRTDRLRLERFLLEHGSNIPRTTVRYAIERFPERRRKEMLRKTK